MVLLSSTFDGFSSVTEIPPYVPSITGIDGDSKRQSVRMKVKIGQAAYDGEPSVWPGSSKSGGTSPFVLLNTWR